MHAIQLLEVGGPEVMTLRELPTPVPAAGQVLVNIAASGANFIDAVRAVRTQHQAASASHSCGHTEVADPRLRFKQDRKAVAPS
jgi:NADPH:quinone reductase-like Zn-dependent oxidoreductase